MVSVSPLVSHIASLRRRLAQDLRIFRLVLHCFANYLDDDQICGMCSREQMYHPEVYIPRFIIDLNIVIVTRGKSDIIFLVTLFSAVPSVVIHLSQDTPASGKVEKVRSQLKG